MTTPSLDSLLNGITEDSNDEDGEIFTFKEQELDDFSITKNADNNLIQRLAKYKGVHDTHPCASFESTCILVDHVFICLLRLKLEQDV